jgi:hypothetical protein
MQRNLIMFANEFDTKSENYLQTRRLLSTTDCFAYEEKDIYYYNSSGSSFMLGGKRIYPFTVDINKINDTRHANCMRKDFYDTPADAAGGILDLSQGTGAATRYEYSVLNLNKNSQTSDSSDISYLIKTGAKGCFHDAECWKYGGNYECGNPWDVQFGGVFLAPVTMPLNLLFGFLGKEGICFDKDDPNSILRMRYIYYTPIEYNLTTRENDANFSCANQTGVRSVFPVMIKTDTGIDPGVMYIKTCTIQGENYNGIPFCQRNFKTGMEECE